MTFYDSMIFDLDGTIWDSRHSVAVARNRVVEKLGLNLPDFTAEDVQKSMGLPMDQVYEMSFSTVSKEDYKNVRLHLDAEIFSAVFERSATLYPHVSETLNDLYSQFSLYLVSNCSTRYLETFLDWSGYRHFFKDMLCNGHNEKPKSENIQLIVSRNHLKHPVYIGDTAGDHSAAKTAGVDYIHADYGFVHPIEECLKISDFSELRSLAKYP